MGRIKNLLRPVYVPILNRISLSRIRTKRRIRILNANTTINRICKEHLSVARFGDGEFSLLLNGEKGIGYQKNSDELRKKLNEVLLCKNERLLICVPFCINSTKGMTSFSRTYWESWCLADNHYATIAVMLEKKAGQDYVFGDAMITRPYIDWLSKKRAKKQFEQLKRIWDKKPLLIVEGSKTRLGVGNDLFANAASIRRIIAPANDAFEQYDKVLDSIKKNHKGELVLIALGPAATVLAYDLSNCGIQAVDIGHIDIEYMWFLMGAKKKVPIPGKYTNECSDGHEVGECDEPEYLREVIEVV